MNYQSFSSPLKSGGEEGKLTRRKRHHSVSSLGTMGNRSNAGALARKAEALFPRPPAVFV